MNSPLKTRALARAAHERRLLAIIEDLCEGLSPEQRESRLRAALTLDIWLEVPPTATVTPKAKVKPKDWRTEQAERTSVTAEKRYGRKRGR